MFTLDLAMTVRTCLILLCTAAVHWNYVAGNLPQTTQQFSHSAVLDADEKLRLYWIYNETHITFEASPDKPCNAMFFAGFYAILFNYHEKEVCNVQIT